MSNLRKFSIAYFSFKVYDNIINSSGWYSSKIKLLLNKIRFGHVWKNQNTFSKNRLTFSVNKKLKADYIKFWKDKFKFIFLCLPFSIISVLLLILILIKFETSDLTMSNLRKFSIAYFSFNLRYVLNLFPFSKIYVMNSFRN
jgi:hypothetical protein